jgi:hypothetical protein
MTKPCASLSLDLDNKWSYLKTHADPGWESFPSYLDLVVPRILHFLKQRDLRITFFIVGQDASLERNHAAIQSVAEAGHEIGNHSYSHEPWLHLYSEPDLRREIALTQHHLEHLTGRRPVGFRGPGFSCSEATLRMLTKLGYEYDCSSFPTFLGPVARVYYFMHSRFDASQKRERRQLFGTFRDGFRPLQPHSWQCMGLDIVEIPVTTFPILRLPMHLSYLMYLGQFSTRAAIIYLKSALWLCRVRCIEPSFLLHPLDFLGEEDEPTLRFFPGMRQPANRKLQLAGTLIDMIRDQFECVTMIEHVRKFRQRSASLGPRRIPSEQQV